MLKPSCCPPPLAAADHLQTPRQHGLFNHHGIDLGDGTVAHYLEGREILRSPLEEFSRGQPVTPVSYPEEDVQLHTIGTVNDVVALHQDSGRDAVLLLATQEPSRHHQAAQQT
jgi:hypothetical protein